MACPWGTCCSPLWSSPLDPLIKYPDVRYPVSPQYLFFPSVKQGQHQVIFCVNMIVKHLEIDKCYGRMILITRGTYCHSCKSEWKLWHWTILTKLRFRKENWTILWDCVNSNTAFDRHVSKWIILPFYFISVVSNHFISNNSFFTLFCFWLLMGKLNL